VQKSPPAEKRANLDDLPSQSESASPPCEIAVTTVTIFTQLDSEWVTLTFGLAFHSAIL